MKKWYVVVDENCSYPEPHEHVWTVSRDPNETGWNTDSGFNGYGLTKADAAEAAMVLAEENKRLREALDEAIYLLNPTQEDMEKKAGIYRIVSARAALKGDE